MSARPVVRIDGTEYRFRIKDSARRITRDIRRIQRAERRRPQLQDDLAQRFEGQEELMRRRVRTEILRRLGID